MALFDDTVRNQLKTILARMGDPVTMVFFSQEIECFTCRDTRSFIEEIASLNEKLKVQTYNLVTDKEKAAQHDIDKVPAILLLDGKGGDTGIRFYGIPGGYEINSFLNALLETSGKREPLPKAVAERIAAIDRDVHIQVFVSLGCPYCPNAVSTAHRLALENGKIRADMVETATFPHLAVKYNVSGVPKVVMNEKHDFTGAQPITTFLDVMEKL
ncbi:MAG: thioredoxin family protein [Spirochaetes bacterium]|nr:thioredoxin family protein [Spirochaetota bacterium]